MLARGAAAEVHSGDEDRGLTEARIVERVGGFFTRLRVEAHIVKSKFPEAIEGDAFHETSGDDTVGINVCAGDENCAASDEGNGIECHGEMNLELVLCDSSGNFQCEKLAGICDGAGDGGSSNHDGRHQDGAARRRALAAFEISVRR